jgi:hypothetical protein
MSSGQWKIILSGDQIAVQRIITLTAGVPQTVTITVISHHRSLKNLKIANRRQGYTYNRHWCDFNRQSS